jgi:hypothetical protein
VELPENYSAYQIAFWLTDESRLSVNIVAQDTAENVVAFFADLAGYDSEEISNINTEKIKDNFSMIESKNPDSAMNLEIFIEPTSKDDDEYEYVEGYKVSLKTQIDPTMIEKYEYVMEQNFNREAVEYIGAGDFIAENEPVGYQILIQTGKYPLVQSMYYYRPSDYNEWKTYFLSQEFTDRKYHEINAEGAKILASYADMGVGIHLSEEKREVCIIQNIDGVNMNITDYVPEVTLSLLGFDEIGEDGNCGREDEDGIRYVIVSKTEWGGDGDYIMLLGDGDVSYKIVYYTLDNEYAIQIQTDDSQAKYYYYPESGSMEPMDEGWEVEDVMRNLKEILPDDEDPVIFAVDIFTDYLSDTFAMTPDELFALEN